MKKRKWLRGKARLLIIAGGVLALALTACGGGSSGDSGDASSGTSTTASGGPGGIQLTDEQRSCIEDKGVTVPDQNGSPPAGGGPPGGGPSGGGANGEDFQKLQQAMQDCGVNMPNPPQGGGNFDPSQMRKQISQYAACVRKNGYVLPEPNTSGNGPVFDSSQVNQNDPKFKAASAKCQDLLPQGGPPQGQ
jgi:hypothetical protein